MGNWNWELKVKTRTVTLRLDQDALLLSLFRVPKVHTVQDSMEVTYLSLWGGPRRAAHMVEISGSPSFIQEMVLYFRRWDMSPHVLKKDIKEVIPKS